MDLCINKVSGINFGRYKEINLDIKSGLHFILGTNNTSITEESNGAGKSTIAELALWVLKGIYNKGKDPSHYWKGECSGTVNLLIDSDEYEITRYYRHKKYGNSIVLIKNGDDISSRNKTSTEQELKKIILISDDIFQSCVFVMQTIPVNVCSITPTRRKTYFEDLVGMSWSSKIQSIDSEVKKNSKELSEKSVTIGNIRNKLSSLESELSVNRDTVEKVDKIDEDISKLDSTLMELRDTKTESSSILLKRVEESKSEISKIRFDLNSKSEEKNRSQDLINKRHCPTCLQDYPESRLSEAEDLSKSLGLEINDLNKILIEHESNLDELESQLRETTDINNRIQSIKSNINSLVKTKNIVESGVEIKSLETRIETLTDDLYTLNDELSAISSKGDHLDIFRSLLLPSSKFRSYVVSRYLDLVNKFLKEISSSVFSNSLIKFELTKDGKGIDMFITRDDDKREVSSFSGGEKSKINIILILALQRFQLEFSGTRCNMLFLDELFDGIDAVGISHVISCLEYLYDPDMSIFVVSHITEVRNNFDSLLEVVSDENGISTLNKDGYK